MKKILTLLTLVSLSIVCFSQTTNNPQIPTIKGKIVFSDTVKTDLTKAEIQARVSDWLINSFLPERGLFNSNDSILGLASCQVLDYLEIEKKALSLFAVYMRYVLICEFKDNQCITSVRNISFIGYDDMNSDDKKDRKDFFSGEFVMLDKKYKVAFVKDASDKITEKAVERVGEVFGAVRNVLR